MRRDVFSSLLLSLWLLAPPACFAWGRDGHKIMAEIASYYLAPRARAAADVMLHGQTLPHVANWADEAKSLDSYHWANPLHYADVSPGYDRFVLVRDCPQEGCVISAVIRFDGVLRRGDAPPAARAEALLFLIHFVADAHQPLHVGRTADRGGNDIQVVFFGESLNLHRVWDHALIERLGKPWEQYSRELRDNITLEQLARWRSTDPVEWANESYRQAVDCAYAIPEDGRLGEEYFERSIPVVNERLAMAGVRLATMLNTIFADADATTSAPVAATMPVGQAEKTGE